MLVTEQQLEILIREEVIRILIEHGIVDENFLTNLGKKAGKAMLPLAMAAGLSGTAQAAPPSSGQLSSTETPITNPSVEYKSAKKLDAKLKERGHSLTPAELNKLARVFDLFFVKAVKDGIPQEKIMNTIVEILDPSIQLYGKEKALESLNMQLLKRIPPEVTATNVQMRDHARIIQSSVLGIHTAARMSPEKETAANIEKAYKELSKNLEKAIKAGKLTKEQAGQIIQLSREIGNMEKINKILGLQN